MGAEAYAQYIHKDLNKGCLAVWEMKVVWTSSSNWERISAAIQLFNTIYIHFSPTMEGERKRNYWVFFPLPLVPTVIWMQCSKTPEAARALWPHANIIFICFIINSVGSFWSSPLYWFLVLVLLQHAFIYKLLNDIIWGHSGFYTEFLLIPKKTCSASLYIDCGGLCAWLLVIWSWYRFRIWCRIEWQSTNEVAASRVLLISPEPRQCNRLQKVVMKSFAVLPSSCANENFAVL